MAKVGWWPKYLWMRRQNELELKGFALHRACHRFKGPVECSSEVQSGKMRRKIRGHCNASGRLFKAWLAS